MDPQQLRDRLKNFAFRCIRLCDALSKDIAPQVISKQLIRSSLSSAANYRAATRAQSKKQFLAKINIALEEIDESCFWIESISELGLIQTEKITLILQEGIELTKILSATKRTAKNNLNI